MKYIFDPQGLIVAMTVHMEQIKSILYKVAFLSSVVLVPLSSSLAETKKPSGPFIEIKSEGNYTPAETSIAPDGNRMAVFYLVNEDAPAEKDKGSAYIKIMDLKNGATLKMIPFVPSLVDSIHLLSDGNHLIAQTGYSLQLISFDNGVKSTNLRFRTPQGNTYVDFMSIEFSADGKNIFTTSTNAKENALLISTEDILRSGKNISEGEKLIPAKSTPFLYLRQTSDGGIIGIKNDGVENYKKIFAQSGSFVSEQSGLKIEGDHFRFSGDGKFLVTKAYQEIHIYSGSGEKLRSVALPKLDIFDIDFVDKEKILIKVIDDAIGDEKFRYVEVEAKSGQITKKYEPTSSDTRLFLVKNHNPSKAAAQCSKILLH